MKEIFLAVARVFRDIRKLKRAAFLKLEQDAGRSAESTSSPV